MTRHPPARSLFAVLVAAALTACGGGDTGVDETAAEAGISSERETDEGPASAGGTGSGADDEDGASPGGPGSEPEGNGGDAGDVGGNPGAPGDVAVFEEAGVTFQTLRTGSAQVVCVELGLCTLTAPVVVAGHPGDVGGVDECLIREKSDIRYDPPARDGRFPEGATVTAHVDCTDPDAQQSEQSEQSEQPEEPQESGETEEDAETEENGAPETGSDGTEGTEPDATDGTGAADPSDDGTGDDGTADQPQE